MSLGRQTDRQLIAGSDVAGVHTVTPQQQQQQQL